MKKSIYLCILFIGIFATAQNQRFTYEYRFVTDSTARNDVKSELMHLDITKKGSKFYSKNAYVVDSIMERSSKIEGLGMQEIKHVEISYVVEKTYPDYKVVYSDRIGIGADLYKVTDKWKFEWKILPDRENIREFKTQKATVSFGGRHWTAWFVPEIPIQDGPYKFHGLPGMIVKIADKTNSHVFELKGIKKLKEDEEWMPNITQMNYRPVISIDKDKYKKLFAENRKNPGKQLQQILNSGESFAMVDENGTALGEKEIMGMNEKLMKEEMARNNNILELDLLQ